MFRTRTAILVAACVVLLAATASADADSDLAQKISALKNIVIKSGGMVSDAVSFENCDRKRFVGGRCVMAARNIQKGEKLLTVPFEAGLSPKKCFENLNENIKRIDMIQNEANAIIAFYLIQEREKMRAGEQSEVGHYLSSLPDFKDLPVYYHEDDLDIIPQGSTGAYNQLLDRVQRSFDIFIEPNYNNATVLLDKRKFTLENWKWAITAIVDRHVPMSLNNTMFSLMLPLVDMFNTHYNHSVILNTGADEKGLDVMAARDISRGEQLYYDLHLESNADMFARAGFALENNPASKVMLILPDLSEDPLRSVRFDLLNSIGVRRDGQGRASVPVYLQETPITTKATMRILEATADEFTVPFGNFTQAVTLRNELNTMRSLMAIGSRLESANNSRITFEEEVKAYQEETDPRQRSARLVGVEARVIGKRLIMDCQVEWNRLLFDEERFFARGSALPVPGMRPDTQQREMSPQDGAQAQIPGAMENESEGLDISDGEDTHWMEREEL